MAGNMKAKKRRRLAVKAIIENPNGDVLLLRRNLCDAKHPARWDFPGGSLNESEEATRGLLREVKEETSLTVIDYQRFFAQRLPQKHQPELIILFFSCTTTGDTTVDLSEEHEEYLWCGVNTAIRNVSGALKNALIEYNSRFNSQSSVTRTRFGKKSV